MSPSRFSSLLIVLTTFSAHAALRPPYGGLLRLSTVDALTLETLSDDTRDRPVEVALRALTDVPLCRLLQAPTASVRRWTFAFPEGAPTVAAALAALGLSSSPYRGLFAPFRPPSGPLKFTPGSEGQTLTMTLDATFDWPDAAKAFCHPAFWMRPKSQTPLPLQGPFIPQKEGGTANAKWVRGRPFLDGFRQLAQQERAASRLYRLKQLDVALGLGTDAAGGYHPYATYLGFAPARRPKPFVEALAGVVDKAELARGFVRAPVVALSPWPLGPSLKTPLPSELTLMFESGSEDARAVAERLLLKLRAAGTKLILQPLSRTDLWTRWYSGQGFDLALLSFLLPPDAPNMLAVLLDIGGWSFPALREELTAIGALSSSEARVARASERLQALGPQLPLLPLYAQGLSWSVSKRVQGLTVDAQGVPSFEEVYLLPE